MLALAHLDHLWPGDSLAGSPGVSAGEPFSPTMRRTGSRSNLPDPDVDASDESLEEGEPRGRLWACLLLRGLRAWATAAMRSPATALLSGCVAVHGHEWGARPRRSLRVAFTAPLSPAASRCAVMWPHARLGIAHALTLVQTTAIWSIWTAAAPSAAPHSAPAPHTDALNNLVFMAAPHHAQARHSSHTCSAPHCLIMPAFKSFAAGPLPSCMCRPGQLTHVPLRPQL